MWSRLVPAGTVWSHLVPAGAVWSQVILVVPGDPVVVPGRGGESVFKGGGGASDVRCSAHGVGVLCEV